MKARITRTDSAGDVPTESFRAEVDGRVREFDVDDGGTIDGSEAVIKELDADPSFAVTAAEDAEAGGGGSGPEQAVEDVAATEE